VFHDLDDIDMSGMTDPIVGIHLMSGVVMAVQDISIIDLGKRLNKYGFVFLSSGDGEYSVIFRHGVAALTALKNKV
jgi:hypothetical protein